LLTAGIVGALIASAAAAIATHLADSISPPPLYKSVNTTQHIVAAPRFEYPAMSAGLHAAVLKAADALATVQSTSGATRTTEVGVVIRPEGMLLVPANGLSPGQSLQVTLANGVPYVGQVVGTDPGSGLAVVHINGAGDLATVTFSRSPVIDPSVALALWSPGRVAYAVGALHDTHETVRIGQAAIVGAMLTDFTPAQCPIGSALLSSTGAIEGIVIGDANSDAVVTPAWLASIVARDLIASGSVVHGWLGVHGVTDSIWPGGVRIVSVAKGSALRGEGVRAGDVIVSFGTVRLRSMSDLRARLYGLRPGVRVTLSVDQNGVMKRHSVVLAASQNP
jgi:S1-C subfamily serine protease